MRGWRAKRSVSMTRFAISINVIERLRGRGVSGKVSVIMIVESFV